jgi:phospholipid/cholesterol/gamma-HCH transport system ATP-binding protein
LTTKEINKTIGEALEMVGLKEEFKSKMPSELSGGMRSRVGLARAIVMKPEIMLYDEPTSALDPIMTDKINDLIISLKNRLKMTSIVISHDIGSAYKVADKIAMIHEGKIIFNGPAAEIRWSRNVYVQQFLRGYRERFYAFDQEDKYAGQADISKMMPEQPQKRGAQQAAKKKPASENIANKKFEMPVRMRPGEATSVLFPPGKDG